VELGVDVTDSAFIATFENAVRNLSPIGVRLGRVI